MIQSKAPSRHERAPAVRSLLARCLVCGALLLLASASSHGQAVLDWSTVVWNDGDLTNAYVLSNGVTVTITVATAASGTFAPAAFGVTSPYEDGPSPPASADFFGTGLDLGILFDPDSGQGLSPVTITVTFSPGGVTDVSFEISDIDFSSPRQDQVVVTCDGSPPDSLVAKTGTPSFLITGGDTATSDGVTSVMSGSDDGTARIDCGPAGVTTVVISYNEVSGVLDPPGRGIGVLFMLTETPVELLGFSVE